ncbi:hypothetical protein BDA96_07G105900 [Sorghum bicolor]|uniref:Uncharacterized protein n=2 Tax=Sorghum bicolor TaxID=4558 RepID=A0A921QJC1_SORBI|nr:hypothetical protein BDA96_07G105900 [Sorghum bicolor]KXG24905.1 hypothetical protein SORBI_3007G099300 [Sorghum bicolor]
MNRPPSSTSAIDRSSPSPLQLDTAPRPSHRFTLELGAGGSTAPATACPSTNTNTKHRQCCASWPFSVRGLLQSRAPAKTLRHPLLQLQPLPLSALRQTASLWRLWLPWKGMLGASLQIHAEASILRASSHGTQPLPGKQS